MRPPFLNDLGMKHRSTGQPTRESKASQIPEIPMFRALLKTRPFLPEGRRRISVACPHDLCRANYFRALPCRAQYQEPIMNPGTHRESRNPS